MDYRKLYMTNLQWVLERMPSTVAEKEIDQLDKKHYHFYLRKIQALMSKVTKDRNERLLLLSNFLRRPVETTGHLKVAEAQAILRTCFETTGDENFSTYLVKDEFVQWLKCRV